MGQFVKHWLVFGVSVASAFTTNIASAAKTETVVTTYVVKTQEERESTRFTLTEWLRIKERMKMMDVWLAMFSNPKEDRFRPELNLVYAVTRGELKATSDTAAEETSELNTTQMRGQLWLTNIFTGSTGVKLVNIDFGIEGYQRESTIFTPEPNLAPSLARKNIAQYYSGNFRLFGKNIQDSSLVAKVGKYETKNSLPAITGMTTAIKTSGRFYGGEIQLYLFRFLGLEGNYLHFAPAEIDGGDTQLSGAYYDYMAYIEISLLRIMGGMFQEDWKYKTAAGEAKTSESGMIFGAKIQL